MFCFEFVWTSFKVDLTGIQKGQKFETFLLRYLKVFGFCDIDPVQTLWYLWPYIGATLIIFSLKWTAWCFNALLNNRNVLNDVNGLHGLNGLDPTVLQHDLNDVPFKDRILHETISDLTELPFQNVNYVLTPTPPDRRMSSDDGVSPRSGLSPSQTSSASDENIFMDFSNVRLYTGHILYIYSNVVKVKC